MNRLLLLALLLISTSLYAASGDISDMQVLHHNTPENDYYEVKVAGEFYPGQIFELYINADNDTATGYADGHGAEYLVTVGWDVFKYIGPDGGSWEWEDGHTWDDYWKYQYTISTASENNDEISIELKSEDLPGLNDDAVFNFKTYSSDWNEVDAKESGVTPVAGEPLTRWDTGAYGNLEDRSQVLSINGATSLTVTIRGETEAAYDFFYIYDAEDNQIAKLDGHIDETLTVQGASIRARLVSDDYVTASGVVVSIQSNTQNSSHAVESRNQASAFLSRATFGATDEAIDALMDKGNYEAWLDEQLLQAPTYHLGWAENNTEGVNGTTSLRDDPEAWKTHADTLGYMQRDIWWQIATHGADQLRQRVALALSEIMVISKNNGELITQPDARISYYDVLVRNALGNFEDLLREVTYHPAMGTYLSYLGNASAAANAREGKPGSHPDENYAREVMQLFTIGLYQLNPDGSWKLDSNGKPIPTYSQSDIREMAKVFTGLTNQNGGFFVYEGETSHHARTAPMIAMEEYHDTTEKRLFGGSRLIAAGGTTKDDVNQALHILFMHPNTGPFIARRLIQRLVTSNPTPEYIGRVAAVFDDNGNGERGDLKAVIKAIFLDDEAMHGAQTLPQRFGKFREPLLYLSHLFRAFHAQDGQTILNVYDDGPSYQYQSYHFNGVDMTKQEAPLEALTVFNYFTPDDAPYALKQMGLVAPETNIYGKQGIDDVLMGIINKNGFIYGTYDLHAELNLDKEKAWLSARNYDALMDYLDTLLTGGVMSDVSKQLIRDYLVSHQNANDDEGHPLTAEKLARYAIALMITSPDYALQR